jgi:predicted esterase
MPRMTSTRRLLLAAGLLAGVFALLPIGPARAAAKDIDTAFKAFWDARTPDDAAKTIPEIVGSGVTFADAWQRLRAGRSFTASAPTGVVRTSYRAHGVEFFYDINVPASYDAMKKYPVRIHLHGGVSRPSNQPRGNGSIANIAGGDEQIYILPTGWEDAEWWTERQAENLRVVLDRVKRTYNVDENRVTLSGTSDGGTGVYYVAMHDTTPYASFTPFIGFIMVLTSVDGAGEQFPNNLRNKPWFIVNDGMDPLYPTRIVTPYVERLREGGVDLIYHTHPESGHNTMWWPEEREGYDAFVRSHPRTPQPETVTWESAARDDNRAHWVVIDRLAASAPRESGLPDVNEVGDGRLMFPHRGASGRVDATRQGNTIALRTRGVAELTLLLSPDVFDLQAPVHVTADGKTVFDGKVEPNVQTLLRWAAHDNDRSMLYGAELKVKL